MRYLHCMLRVRDLDAALRFFVDQLGLVEARRREHDAGRFTLVFLRTPADASAGDEAPEIELTYNWDQAEPYETGRFFGHLAFEVDSMETARERVLAHGGSEVGAQWTKTVAGEGTITLIYMTDPDGNAILIDQFF